MIAMAIYWKFTFHYVSILMNCDSKRGSPLLIYIPLCLYFNNHPDTKHYCESVIYIPLCLYFNWITQTAWSSWPPFTFHYVSILILIFSELVIQIFIYIPLCLYFNRIFRMGSKRGIRIYIPLCLYFNGTVLTVPDLPEEDLHSIMSLF